MSVCSCNEKNKWQLAPGKEEPHAVEVSQGGLVYP